MNWSRGDFFSQFIFIHHYVTVPPLDTSSVAEIISKSKFNLSK